MFPLGATDNSICVLPPLCPPTLPGYELRIVGHSLGGGTAALLTMMLRERGGPCGRATCLALACPSCMTLELAASCADYVTTVVNAADVIPTVSPGAADRLREEVMRRWVGGGGCVSGRQLQRQVPALPRLCHPTAASCPQPLQPALGAGPRAHGVLPCLPTHPPIRPCPAPSLQLLVCGLPPRRALLHRGARGGERAAWGGLRHLVRHQLDNTKGGLVAIDKVDLCIYKG